MPVGRGLKTIIVSPRQKGATIVGRVLTASMGDLDRRRPVFTRELTTQAAKWVIPALRHVVLAR